MANSARVHRHLVAQGLNVSVGFAASVMFPFGKIHGVICQADHIFE